MGVYGVRGFSPAISAICGEMGRALPLLSAGEGLEAIRGVAGRINPSDVPGLSSFLSHSQISALTALHEGRGEVDRGELQGAAEKLLVVQSALKYHFSDGQPGKLSVRPIKPLGTQSDLSTAYSPHVAWPCLEIQRDPTLARIYTRRGNLVGQITDGSATLGIGDVGPLAAKPVGEGKGNLFSAFGGIDVFDLELDATPAGSIAAIEALWPTFGAINLEDYAAPHCFEVLGQLRSRLRKKAVPVPIWHDDQQGTAVVAVAALINALKIQGKYAGRENCKFVFSGAGAAGVATANMFVDILGIPKKNIIMVDSKGVIHKGRADFNTLHRTKRAFAQETDMRTLAEVVRGADVFVGLSTRDVLTADMVRSMADKPIIFAMANPDPEIRPELARAARPDVIIATGRSDYSNQANNVLVFPGMLAGALDVGSTEIVTRMTSAAAYALAEVAREAVLPAVNALYGRELTFGPDYILPTPFDPRVLLAVAPAVAEGAVDAGKATYPFHRADYKRFLREVRLKNAPIQPDGEA